jgi:protein gp37
METAMTEIAGTSRAAGGRAEWFLRLRRALLGLARPFRDHGRPRRINEQEWSDYMLRDIGLGADIRHPEPRDPRLLP